MMGVQAASAQLFYDFCLDDHVPSDHMLRGIERHLELDDLRQSLKPFYSQIGRPSVDPELMIRMLIVGYCMGIRSERRLCEEVHLNLAYRWFCRLGLDGRVPDHSTFSKNRHGRFRESDALRRLFESVVQRCIVEGLVSADGFAVDASLIAADANKQRSVPSHKWKPEEIKEKAVRAAREYLSTLDDAAFGAASPATPKFTSRSDPAAQWTGAHKGHAFFAYSANYLIDTHHGVIVDVEATRAIRQAEVGAARTMIERTETRFGVKPDSLTAEHALRYAVERKQFGKPIGGFQLVQDLLVRMLGNVTACQTMMLRLAQLQDQGAMADEHASLAKAFTTVKCRETVGYARELLGGNGILLENHIGRFVADAEAIYSYEGTREMNTLIVGKAITGLSAFI
jgi:transposase